MIHGCVLLTFYTVQGITPQVNNCHDTVELLPEFDYTLRVNVTCNSRAGAGAVVGDTFTTGEYLL